MTPGRLGRTAALIALCGASTAAADSLEPPDPGDYLRWGPVRVRPGLELSNVGYDDNILASSLDPISDFRATLSPKLAGLVLFGDRAFLEFNEKLAFTEFVDNRDQSYTDQLGSAQLTVPFNRHGFVLDGHLNRVSELPIDLDDVRPQRRENGLRVAWLARPGWRLDLEVGVSHRTYAYDDPDFSTGAGQTIGERLDRSEDRGDFSVTYRLFGALRAVFEGHRAQVEFDTLTPAGRSKDSQEEVLLAGLDFGEDRPLSGSLRLGRVWIDAEDAAFVDLSRSVGEAELVYRPGHRTTFTLEGKRRPGFSLSTDTLYFVHTYATLRAVHYLTRVFGVEASATDGELAFPAGTASGRRDDLSAYSVGVRLRVSENALGRRIAYSLRYGRDRRDSTIDLLDRSRTTVGVGAVLGF